MVKLATIDEELKKCPEFKIEYLNAIKDWMRLQPHLPQIDDDLQLALFLRANDYSIEKTKINIDNYYTFRTHAPELCTGRNTKKADIKQFFDIIELTVLPQRDPEGNLVVIERIRDVEPSKLNMEAAAKVNLMLMESFLLENGSVPGLVMILDQKGFTLSHLARIPLSIPKKFFYYGQECANIAVKAIHIIHTTSLIDKILAFIKPFMNKHFQSMFYAHAENSMDEFYKMVPREILPLEYGGNAGKFADLHEQSRRNVERFNGIFEKLDAITVDETKRVGKKVSASELFGMEGSFKKLDID